MGLFGGFQQPKFQQPQDFFADCNGDIIAMFDKLHEYNRTIGGIEIMYMFHIQEAIYREMLSSHNGSAADSKSACKGSTPFDSAIPPTGQS
jgi:hypothetical protein